jgi:hypothetical protein
MICTTNRVTTSEWVRRSAAGGVAVAVRPVEARPAEVPALPDFPPYPVVPGCVAVADPAPADDAPALIAA